MRLPTAGVLLAIFFAGFLLAALLGVIQLSGDWCEPAEPGWACTREWLIVLGAVGTLFSVIFLTWQIIVTRRQIFSTAVEHLRKRVSEFQKIRMYVLAIDVFLEHLRREITRDPRSAGDIVALIDAVGERVDGERLFDAIVSAVIPEHLNDQLSMIAEWWNDKEQRIIDFQGKLLEATIQFQIGEIATVAENESIIDRAAEDLVKDIDEATEVLRAVQPVLKEMLQRDRRRLIAMNAWFGDEIDTLLRLRRD